MTYDEFIGTDEAIWNSVMGRQKKMSLRIDLRYIKEICAIAYAISVFTYFTHFCDY